MKSDHPKQWHILSNGKTVLETTLIACIAHVDDIFVVGHPEDGAELAKLQKQYPNISICYGGNTRSQSVYNGLTALQAMPAPPKTILIHDAARALCPDRVIQDVKTALQTHKAAAPALAVTDALWRGVPSPKGQMVHQAVDRSALYRAQTPQGFCFQTLRAAYDQNPSHSAADDVEIARLAGIETFIIEGHEENFKITYPDDITRANTLITIRENAKVTEMDIRLGNGYDVHRFGEGDHLWLCGVQIEHTRGLQGHSDADVGLHALTDAIYGALAMGDIGRHFPPSDPQWRGASSDIFLKHAVNMAHEQGFQINNCDVTLVCEQPKITPYAQTMRETVAKLLQIEISRCSIKATTSERLGFTGRKEGIAALATATVLRP